MQTASLLLVQRIRQELQEAPDLRLSVKEAARFWGLEEQTCHEILNHLVAAGFLARSADGRYRVVS
jgi:DNA-binding IclR family transcriptional regulator